ncbi:MAG: N-acetylmuramoyl-L-alanine amidase [Gammaproteobacteria bacterium]
MPRGLFALLLSIAVPCQAASISGPRMWAAPDNTRVVFDLSAPVTYHLFTMTHPHRVVLDIEGGRFVKPPPPSDPADRFLKSIRYAPHGQKLRLVLDLKQRTEVKGFALAPQRPYGHRLVVDLLGHEAVAPQVAPLTFEQLRLRNVVIAIDAGHGGEDPGAIGKRGAREKQVVLAIARELAQRVNDERGMRAVLIRDGDYFLSLRNRIKRARQHKADLFVSIHADAFRDPQASGSSVYVLSRHGASSEAARWLAERENASDLVGGVSLDDKDDLLRKVLLDLSQTAAIDASVNVGGRVLQRLNRLGKIHHQGVQRAGFAVLKSPDIPSVLVETAFITNPLEERKLTDPRHQGALAAAILDGIRAYFLEAAPPGTLLAMHKDTLSEASASTLRALR